MRVSGKWLALAGVVVLGACSTAAQRRAAQAAEIRKEGAKEVRRICALPESTRQAEIKKLEDESGITVNCGKD